MTVDKLRTYARLGIGNVLRVAVYRLLLKFGRHPVQSIQGEAIAGSIFNLDDHEYRVSLLSRCDWLRGTAEYFGNTVDLPVRDNGIPNWHDPFGFDLDASSQKQPWWSLSDFDPKAGDIKKIWEFSRFDWLLAMSQRASLGNSKELNRLNLWLNDWIENNPPYLGRNWKCGQEASIRVLHLAMSAMILGQIESASENLRSLIRMHLRRISPTMNYAIGQSNNHGTSEAAALFIGGSWLGDEQGRLWQDQGHRWLVNRSLKLIESDGTFSQYSVNYHRLMLDTYSFCEVWRRRFKLSAFGPDCLSRLESATAWLNNVTDIDTGDVPNIGANDGAYILKLTAGSYRDYRPSVQLASILFHAKRAYRPGPWDQQVCWMGIELPDSYIEPSQSVSLDKGGLHILRNERLRIYFRYPRFHYRPSQADALHCDVWVGNINLLRDGGTYSYNATSEDTSYFNGTSAHNTVEFDGRDQMPRLSRFLFGRWLDTIDVSPVTKIATRLTASAAYKDYRGAYHLRQLALESNGFEIVDTVRGFRDHAILRWRLAPGSWTIEKNVVTGNGWALTVQSSVPIIRCELLVGSESRIYLEKTNLPVLEVEISEPGQITTNLKSTV